MEKKLYFKCEILRRWENHCSERCEDPTPSLGEMMGAQKKCPNKHNGLDTAMYLAGPKQHAGPTNMGGGIPLPMTLRLRFSPRPPPVPGPAGDAAPGGGHERALKGCGFWGDAAGCAFPGTSEGSIYRAKGPPSPLFLKIRVQQAEARTRVRIEILQCHCLVLISFIRGYFPSIPNVGILHRPPGFGHFQRVWESY